MVHDFCCRDRSTPREHWVYYEDLILKIWKKKENEESYEMHRIISFERRERMEFDLITPFSNGKILINYHYAHYRREDKEHHIEIVDLEDGSVEEITSGMRALIPRNMEIVEETEHQARPYQKRIVAVKETFASRKMIRQGLNIICY